MRENKILSRRDFIKFTAVACGVLVGGKLLFEVVKDSYVSVTETRLLMGTIINLAVVADSKAAGEKAVAATFAELERLAAIFTHRESESPVAVLNKMGKLAMPPQELVEVLSQAIKISEISKGAFDVTIKPLVDLYRQAQPGLPGVEAIEAVLDRVDYRQLDVSTEEISLSQPGMAVTLDGIAKGYIVDAGAAVLKKLGYENVYVEAGGDLMACGKKGGDVPWKIGIQSPREQKKILARMVMSNQAVASSGDYIQSFCADLSQHHILNPLTGYSSPELASVSVIAPNALAADAYATAIMALGLKEGLRLLEKSSQLEGYLVTKDLEIFTTRGFPGI